MIVAYSDNFSGCEETIKIVLAVRMSVEAYNVIENIDYVLRSLKVYTPCCQSGSRTVIQV